MTSASLLGCVDDALDDVAVLARSVCAEDGHRHHLDAGVADAGDAGAVVGLGRDDSSHRGAVPVRVAEAVRAVEDRRARDDVAVEVGMRAVDARVQDRNPAPSRLR